MLDGLARIGAHDRLGGKPTPVRSGGAGPKHACRALHRVLECLFGDRLDEMIDRPRRLRVPLAVEVALGCHEDRRNPEAPADLGCDLRAVPVSGQPHVHQDEVGPMLPRGFDSRRAASSHTDDVMTELLKKKLQEQGNERIILDDQDQK